MTQTPERSSAHVGVDVDIDVSTMTSDELIAHNLKVVEAHFHNETPETVDKAIALDPMLVDAHLSQGVIKVNLQKWDEARAHFEEALRLSPGSVPARDALEQLKALGH